MHVHLPKPLHGWREFVGEVGVIVLGVLIALGFEQLVDTLHWRYEVAQSKASLRNEIIDHYLSASVFAIAEPCVDQQLLALEQAVLAPGPYKPVPMYRDAQTNTDFTYRAPSRPLPDAIWRSIVSEGAYSHFDSDLRQKLNTYYALVALLQAGKHNDFLWQLRILARPIQPDASARIALAQQVEEARGDYGLEALGANQIMGRAEDMGIFPDKEQMRQRISASFVLKFCRDHHLPLGRIQPQKQA